MRDIFKRILLLPLLGIVACSTVELEGSGSITPDAITGSETVHGSLYGYRWKPFTTEKCGTDSLFRVETHTNAGLLLASVLTLGFYVPQTVEWWCYAPDNGDAEDEEVWDPNADMESPR
ncbi:MAG: hypothetical protein AAF385_01870 [Pseudomonadota bacterium]